MANLKFRGNEYADRVKGIDAPKAVWMAIAYSLALQITGATDWNEAAAICGREWGFLHNGGIVPQKPRFK